VAMLDFYRTVHPVEDVSHDELAQYPVRKWYRFFDVMTTRRRLWGGNGVQPPIDFVRILFDTRMEKAITQTTKVESKACRAKSNQRASVKWHIESN
jgi:hypothetical protein